jgi:indolepyruvate decarboxylase
MTISIADYLVRRLQQHSVDTLFGIPGTSCAAMFDSASKHGLATVINSSELDAGYAVDGYARMRGLGVVSVSYGVGTLSLINAIAGALVERAPVIVVNGGPAAGDLWRERRFGVLFSHSTGRSLTDLTLFKEVTAYAARVERAVDAPNFIDQAITTALREQRPVYIEVPTDLWGAPCVEPVGNIDSARTPVGSEGKLAKRIAALLGKSERPAILLGEEVARYRLADDAERLVTGSKISWATTLLAKSVLAENTSGFVGVYDSDFARKPVARLLEESDCLLALGCTFGIDHSKLVTSRHGQLISVVDGWCRIGDTAPERVELSALIPLLAVDLEFERVTHTREHGAAPSFEARRSWVSEQPEDELTHEQIYRTVDRHLDPTWVIVHDTCLGSYPSADLNVKGRNAFICCPVWLSIGHSIGAAIGVGMADKCRRPLVICGDGGFQTTAPGLSAMARQRIPVVIILINNGLYGIEQYLIAPNWFCETKGDPLPYVGLHRWDYPALAHSMGFEHALEVTSVAQLDTKLIEARSWTTPGLISVRVRPRDLPPENLENLSCDS